jgi:hypothetical protein
VTYQLRACRLDRRREQPSNDRGIFDDINLQRFGKEVDGRILNTFRMLDHWP